VPNTGALRRCIDPRHPLVSCVLISRLAECIHLTNQDIAQVSVR
jgi:hypothetical protein